jgi:hypothetical protein
MAIPSYEGIASNTAFASSITVDISGIDGGSPPTVGDLLIANVSVVNISAPTNELITAPDGWHKLGKVLLGHRDALFWKIRESGDSNSVQFGHAGIGVLNTIAYIHCIRGADKARPIVRQSINYEDSGTYNWDAETTPVADCLAIASVNLAEGNNTGASPASGWTERLDIGIGILIDELTSYVQTRGFATQGSSTGNPSTDIPGIVSYQYIARMILVQPPQTATPKDIRVATGTFASPTSTGNQDFTNLGFDCKALIIYGIRNSDQSAVTDIEYTHGIGADDGVTSAAQRCFGVWHDSGSGAAGYSRNGEIIALYIAGNSTLGSPDLLATYSRITGGFRLNWTSVMGSGYAFSYMAFGGADFQAACGAVQASAGSVSGLNFRPEAVHIIGQCLDSDSDQLRTVYGLGACGWLDCQTGAQFYSFIDTQETGNGEFIFRDSGLYGQSVGGTPGWEIEFAKTNSDGWNWAGTDSDYFFYLAMYFGGTTYFPYQVEYIESDDSGTGGADQYLPSFALDQTYATKKLIHALGNRDGTDVGLEAGGCSEGHVKFSYEAVDQDGMAIAKIGSTSERRRATFQAILMHSSGDLDSIGKLGRFYYPDYIDWQVNNTVDHLIGLFTLGFIGQVYTRIINDTISVSDNLDVEMFYGRTTVSDNVSVTDSIQRVHDAHRIINDTISVTDQIQREHDAVRIINDTVNVSDQVYTNLEYERSINDTVSISDQIQSEHDAVRIINDTVSVSDSLSTELSYGRTLSDTVSVTDSIQREHDAHRIVGDAISITDQASTELEYGRAVGDTVSVTDQIQREHDAVRTIDDTVSVTDQIQRVHDAHRIISDSISVTDQIQRAHDASRIIDDSISVTDQIQRAHESHRIINDNISISDSINVNTAFCFCFSDPINVIDQILRAHDAVRTINDQIAVIDSVVRNMYFERSVNDTVNITDQLVVEFFIERTVSDTISVSDQLSRDHDSSRTFDDNVSVVDQIAIEVFIKNVDSISVIDQVVVSLEYERSFSDSVSVTDSVKATLEFERSFSDSVSLSDSLSIELEYGRIISDSISVVDSIQYVHDAHRIISDTVSTTDQIVPEVFRDYGDMVGIIDELKVSLVYGRIISDYVVTYDTFSRGKEIGYAISDSVNIIDQISTEMNFGRVINDSTNVSDQLIAEFIEGQIKREFYETIGVTDSLSIEMEYGRTVSDSVNVLDQILTGYAQGITINDSVSVSDQLIRSQDVNIEINDSINVSDQASAGIFDYAFFDSVSLSDSLSIEMEYGRLISDTVSTVDQIVSQITGEINITINDTISVADSIQREHDAVRNISDSVSVSDLLGATSEREISDSINVSDQLIAETSYNRSISDTINVTDSIQREHDAVRSITDSIQVDDTISVSTGGIILLSDSVNVVEQLSIEMEYGRTISETISVTDQTSALAERIFDIAIGDSINVSETFISEVEYHRIISDSVSVTDQLSVFTPSFDVEIDDSISVEDLIIVSLEKAKTIFDSIQVSDSIESELTLGAYVSDNVFVTDQILADLIFTTPDELEVVDLLLVEVNYSRSTNDSVEIEDSIIEGAQILLIHGIEDGINYGPLKIYTVSPTGPLSISGGRDCYPIPTGFVIIKGDYVECNDRLDSGMIFEQTIDDSVQVTG